MKLGEQPHERHREIVAPYAGAWIEMITAHEICTVDQKSLPTRERGLKFKVLTVINLNRGVAPYAGAWIEIEEFVGEDSSGVRRSLRGSVD